MLFSILQENFEKFEKAFNKLSNKSEKLLGKAFELKILGKEKKEISVEHVTEIKGDTRLLPVVNIEILNAAIPALEGWQFAAVINFLEDDSGKNINIIKSAIADIEIPKKYRETNKICEHCMYARKRINTYLVYNEERNEFKQVGKNCLRDYTGNQDILSIASLFENLLQVRDEFSFNGSFEGNLSDKKYFQVVLPKFLQVALAVIKAFGWVSSSYAFEHNKVSTKERIMRYFWLQSSQKTQDDLHFLSKIKLSENDENKIAEIIEYFSSLDEENCNDYLYNCYAVAKAGIVTLDVTGIAASMVNGYEKAMEIEKIKRVQEKSEHFGEIKEKINARVKILNIAHVDSFYGVTSYITMQVIDGVYNNGKKKDPLKSIKPCNVLVWKASSSSDIQSLLYAFQYDLIINIKGTIKDHTEYKNFKQTQISHCSVDPFEMDQRAI